MAVSRENQVDREEVDEERHGDVAKATSDSERELAVAEARAWRENLERDAAVENPGRQPTSLSHIRSLRPQPTALRKPLSRGRRKRP